MSDREKMEAAEEADVLDSLRATRRFFTTAWRYQSQYRAKAFERLESRGDLVVRVVGETRGSSAIAMCRAEFWK